MAGRLRAVVEEGGDASLDRARRIGESALEAGSAIADVVELHRRALDDAAASADDARRRRIVEEAPAVLRALLAPFEESVQAGRAARDAIAEARREAQRHADGEAAARRELESFAYSVSHDLHAPLRTIDGFSQVLLEDHAEKLDARGKEYIDHLRSSAVRMGELIDGLVSLTRVGRKEMCWEPVDLGRMAEAVAGRLRAAYPGRRVDFVVENDLHAQGDPELVERLLEELIGNAWKFTARRDVARVEVGRRADDGQPVFYVRDNGAGFDMRYAAGLFGVFRRLHGVTDFEGAGIGLALAQRTRGGGWTSWCRMTCA
ncbi:MAG: hypothetical protein JOZ69_24950, partial [Myxococcales bacterium]|nr:hypothetical protein [Myxococcales bacterium]